MRKNIKSIVALMVAVLMLALSVGSLAAPEFEPGPKLGDVRVRQALLYALDRENFIKAQYGSEELARVGLAAFSPTSWAFPDESELNPYAYDLEKAAALLDEAGWTLKDDGYRYNADGLKLSLRWLVYEDSPWPGTLSSMAFDSWKQIGVELVIDKMDFVTVAAKTHDPVPGEKDFDIYTMGFSLSAEPDPSGGLFDYEAFTAGGFNSSGYYNERSQELIKQGKASFVNEERAAVYKEWAKLMNEEVPTAIIAYRAEIWGVNDRVKNMNLDTFSDWPSLLGDVELEGEQTLKIGETSFDGIFNPIYADKVYDTWIVDSVFEGLIKVNELGEYVTNIAESYELSNDNRTYTLTLKDGIKFSDGMPLTTADVAYTYMMIASPEYTGPRIDVATSLEGYDEYFAGTADTVSGIKLIDEKTIAFTFTEASPANLSKLGYGIMPMHIYAMGGTTESFLSLNSTPVGSGKFVLTAYEPNQYIILERNEDYWDAENAAKIERVSIENVPDETKLQALESGQIDLAQPSANVDHYDELVRMEGVSPVTYLGNGYTYICFNTLH